MTFGKNRVQYKDFIWLYYRFDRLDTYFYQGGAELAQFTSKTAKAELHNMEKRLGYKLEEKIQFLVFNNYSDLRQTNIGLQENESYNYNTGGISHIKGNRVLLYFDGDHNHLRIQIREGIAEMIFNQMVYGSSVGAQIKNNALIYIPEWYKKGLVSYLAESWNTEKDNELRDLFLHNKVKKFNQILSEHTALAGHSMWYFIEQTYGMNSLNALVQMSRLNHGVELSLLYALGVNTKQLFREWYKFYERIYSSEQFDAVSGKLLPLKYRKYRKITAINKQPGGQIIAYATNELGQSSLFLYDKIKGKSKRCYKKGFRVGEFQDLSYPLLSWHPMGKILAFIVEEKGLIFLHLYNPATREIEVRNMHQFTKISQFSFNNNGTHLILAGVRNGQSDLFYFNIAANSYKQLTDDIYDDLYPVFSEHNDYIYFSSNRPHDSLSPLIENQRPLKNLNVFAYAFKNKHDQLINISKTKNGNCIYPKVRKDNSLFYLSDESGIRNVYLGAIDSTINHVDTIVHYRYTAKAYPITNLTQSVDYLDVDQRDQDMFVLSRENDMHKAYKIDFTALPKEKVVVEETVFYRRKLEVRDLQKKKRSSLSHNKKRKRFYVSRRGGDDKEREVGSKEFVALENSKDTTAVDLNIPLPSYEDLLDTMSFPKKRNYYVEFFINKVTARLDYSYLNTNYQPYTGGKNDFFFGPDGGGSSSSNPIYLNGGYNGFFELGISDLMEDHRLSGGVKLSPDLVNNEYIASYSNLKNRTDYKLTFHRQIYENSKTDGIQRVYSHEMILQASYPFNEALSWKSSLAYRNQHGLYLAVDTYSLSMPKTTQNWGILRQELVFDGTRSLGLNLYEGSRYKLFGEYYQLFDKLNENLFVLGLDIRKYIRIHRDFIWANRLAASTSFGRNKLLYYMGGVDSWLTPKFSSKTPVDYRERWAFQTLATNMRGFKQNIRNGNNFVVFNSELRFPVLKYIMNRPLRSDLLNNFQIVGFGDIGTAWTGWDPFSKENALYTYYIHNGPMRIRVETDKDPLVGGFGTGLRTRLLGYFIRTDLAWGIENAVVQDPVFYVSLSLDF
ncbi:MAG: hypothetical protein ACEPOW_00290 [Bacteroidales bacterium]